MSSDAFLHFLLIDSFEPHFIYLFIYTLPEMTHYTKYEFFNYINIIFGYYIVTLLKNWIKLNKETILINLRLEFLCDCKNHGF